MISVSTTETLYAIATQAGYTNSSVASAAYTINGALASPTFSPVAGTYTSIQSVTISGPGGATLCYATSSLTQGATPGTCGAGWTTLSGTVSVAATETLYAYATEAAWTNSSTASAAYTINVATAGSMVPVGTVLFSGSAH
jgi:hypothetical protein